MLAFPRVGYDDAALVAFPPDGSRAAFLYARMIERLAQSVEEIVQGCSSHLRVRRKRCCGSHSAFARHLALPPSCTASISTC